MWNGTIKNVGLFFLIALLISLLIFFEKKISLVHAQLLSEQKVLKSFQHRLEAVQKTTQSLEELSEKIAIIEERFGELECSPKHHQVPALVDSYASSGKEDVVLLLRTHLSELVKTSQKSKAKALLNNFASIDEQRKQLWLDALEDAPSWEDFIENLRAQKETLEEGTSDKWDWVEKFGITIARKEKSEQLADTLEGFLSQELFERACIFLEDTNLSEESQVFVEKLCHFEATVDKS